MKVEQKKLSNTEMLAYFSDPLPIIGTFYGNNDISMPILNDVNKNKDLSQVLLTSDFLYLKAFLPENLNKLWLPALAEIEDYFEINKKIIPATSDHTKEKITLLLQTVIAPFLQHDGGDVQFVELNNNVVTVRFLGKCQNCPHAQSTLTNHVRKNLCRYLPNVREVKLI